ncbi:MAG: hypothetical protein EOP54_15660 [Sphingobacteriales bacterium]|nr:MAG: hypothetical protein EOP54_15660 [Sphingobacteriales bacterium]
MPEGSGWEKVGTVKYTYTTVGFANMNAMEPVELEKIGSQINILYSENYQLSGVIGRQFYKAKLNIGANNTAETTKISLPSGTDEQSGLCFQYLIPGAYEAMATSFLKNGQPTYLHIVNEQGQHIGNQFVGHPGRTASVYSNGDVLAGTIDYAEYAELDFYNKTSNTWTIIKGTSHDTTLLVGYTPFRLPDGSLKAFNITAKEKYGPDNKVYISIAHPAVNPVGQQPLFTSEFLQRIPEFETDFYANAYPKIICSSQEENTFTVVIGTFPYNSQIVSKLFAYSWTPGSTNFKKLYGDVPVSEYIHDKLKSQNIRCRADGTVYFWDQSLDGKTGALTTIDASGIYSAGKVTFTDEPILIGAVKYLDGAYYAAVYPFTDQFDAKHNLRMDIVKLK